MLACGYIGWHGTSGRPGSGSEAQHGGIGTQSSRPCWDRDMRMQPPDTIQHRAFAEFANKSVGCRSDTAARKLIRAGSNLEQVSMLQVEFILESFPPPLSLLGMLP